MILGGQSLTPTAWIVGRWGYDQLIHLWWANQQLVFRLSSLANISKYSLEGHLLRPILHSKEVFLPFGWSRNRTWLRKNQQLLHPMQSTSTIKNDVACASWILTHQNTINIWIWVPSFSQQTHDGFCADCQVASEFYVLLEGSPKNQVLGSRNGVYDICIFTDIHRIRYYWNIL